MPSWTESRYISDVLKSEGGNSRERVTVLAGSGAARLLPVGTVIGRITAGNVTAAAAAGNTGNGTIGAITVGVGAKVGVYRVVVIEPDVNGGRFTVEDPDGITVGVGSVAAAFGAGGLSFTLADGATDFVAGDAFTITVGPGSGKVVAIDFAGTDGRANAYGVMVVDVTAPDGADAPGVAAVRESIVVRTMLVWPDGATTDQKNAAIAQLEAAGILCR